MDGAEEDSLTIPDVSIIESSAELLYGLVHQRFILTKPGLTAMVRLSSQASLLFPLHLNFTELTTDLPLLVFVGTGRKVRTILLRRLPPCLLSRSTGHPLRSDGYSRVGYGQAVLSELSGYLWTAE